VSAPVSADWANDIFPILPASGVLAIGCGEIGWGVIGWGVIGWGVIGGTPCPGTLIMFWHCGHCTWVPVNDGGSVSGCEHTGQLKVPIDISITFA